ncbi:hypothetical protein DBR17_19695 [Sphingomonas sp. HMWF008]|nr:hypothetical protein DBR17_19695 [Sphingomonas sp. HMWF008]
MVVASEIELAGSLPLAASSQSHDVVMRMGEVPQTLSNATISRPGWDADGDDFLVRAPGIGRFLLKRGEEVVFELEPGVPAQAGAAYLQGTVMGALLHQRGGIVLHASGIEADGGAILFAGASGEGKSTLVAALSTRGYPVVCDDVSHVSFDREGRPLVSSDARRLKLTDESIHATGLEMGRRKAVLANTDKSYVKPAKHWTGYDLPLRAVYLLRSAAVNEAVVARLPSALALNALRGNAHRPKIVLHTGQLPRYFEASVKILECAPVYVVDRGRDLSKLASTIDILEAHWRTCPWTARKRN